MLIGCSVLFIACGIPGVMFKVIILFIPDMSLGGRYHNTFNFLTSVTRLCNYINFSFNFFIYYTIGSKFTATLHTLCGRRGMGGGSESKRRSRCGQNRCQQQRVRTGMTEEQL